MKIAYSISKIYNDKKPLAEKLMASVDSLINKHKQKSWHYFSRLKSEESFALKLETGRFKKAEFFEDFFACTIVVENINAIENAEKLISTLFNVKTRKPSSNDSTHKDSSSFQFDELRLYVNTKKVDYLPSDSLSDMTFEIQIKTFLQHAWSIATHDLIYKSDTISWAKERVAYQVKAMLEQAEISISGAEGLSQLPELKKNNNESKSLNEIKEILIASFPAEALPFDLLRLTRIINDVLKVFDIKLTQLVSIIESETALHRGTETLNLSPYGIIIQSIINQKPLVFEKVFKTGYGFKTKGLFIPPEISLDKITIEDSSKLVVV